MNHYDIITDFINKIEEYNNTGTVPNCVNQDLKHYLEIRYQRLKKLNITESMIIDKNYSIREKDFLILGKSKYNHLCYYACLDIKKQYKINNSVIYNERKYPYYYFTIYDIDNKPNYNELLYNCPNCGSPSQINILESNGCPYCNTKFIVKDLFPKISNIYTLDIGNKSMKHNARDFKIIFFIVLVISLLSGFLLFFINRNNMVEAIVGLIVGLIFGAFIGYVVVMSIWVVSFFGKMFTKSASNFDLLPKLNSSKEKIDNIMKQYNTNFSYTYFESKVLNLVKNILLDDKRELSPQNKINDIDPSFNNLIDITYRQVIELNACNLNDNVLSIQLLIYLENDYFVNNKVNTVRETLLVNMKHDQSHDVDMEFSLSAVKCEKCGASFDASHETKCKYCGSDYHPEYDDWIVTCIKKI